MSSFDADLVGRWFRRLLEEPVMPHWGIVPTAQESDVLRVGGEKVLAAVQGDAVSGPPDLASIEEPDPASILKPEPPSTEGPEPPPIEEPEPAPTEEPARLLLGYLTALAAGIAGTRSAFAASTGARVPDPDGAGPGAVDIGTMALVAGLNAGAAALHGEVASPVQPPGRQWRVAEPTAAESARQAGVAAAELVVNGAELREIAASAADVAMVGWRIGVPDDPVGRIEYRTRGLLGILLVALEQETGDPEPIGEPASCGALPGENLGRPFTAEITFTMGLAPAEQRSLADDLARLGAEVHSWPGRDSWPRFHVHTDRPGAVVGQVYAQGTPFDLEITDRT